MCYLTGSVHPSFALQDGLSTSKRTRASPPRKQGYMPTTREVRNEQDTFGEYSS